MRPSRPVPPERAASYRRAGFWDDRTLRDGIEAAAAARPTAVAVIDNHRQMRWAELAGLVAAGTRRLVRRGVGSGDPVVLISGNTADGVVAYHSMLRAGTPAVLLDRRCGPADLEAALSAVAVAAVILPRSEESRLDKVLGTTPTFPLEEFGGEERLAVAAQPGPEPDRGAVAVVLFTSGTTSRPKGVLHSLNTLTAGARNMALITGADEHTVLFLVSPMTSVTGVMQMHLAADEHATLVLEDAFEPQASLDRINRYGATLVGGAPVIAERVIGAADTRPGRPLALRTLALGGAMLPRPLLEHAGRDYGIDIARVYGSSEAPNTTGSLPGEPRERRLLDDGELMPGTEVRVGSAAHPQEGMLRGPGLFLGYLDPADNQTSFEDDWYRTGDLVEVAGGRLTVVGRVKELVNRNGFKISLSEIDAALLGLPGVEETASFGLADETTGERLAVAVLPKQGAEITLDAVVSHLRDSGLATRKLPEQVVIWDGPLPRTASGKVVRSRLLMESSSKQSCMADRLTGACSFRGRAARSHRGRGAR